MGLHTFIGQYRNITLWYSSAFVCGISFVLGCLLAVKYMKGGGFYF